MLRSAAGARRQSARHPRRSRAERQVQILARVTQVPQRQRLDHQHPRPCPATARSRASSRAPRRAKAARFRRGHVPERELVKPENARTACGVARREALARVRGRLFRRTAPPRPTPGSSEMSSMSAGPPTGLGAGQRHHAGVGSRCGHPRRPANPVTSQPIGSGHGQPDGHRGMAGPVPRSPSRSGRYAVRSGKHGRHADRSATS